MRNDARWSSQHFKLGHDYKGLVRKATFAFKTLSPFAFSFAYASARLSFSLFTWEFRRASATCMQAHIHYQDHESPLASSIMSESSFICCRFKISTVRPKDSETNLAVWCLE